MNKKNPSEGIYLSRVGGVSLQCLFTKLYPDCCVALKTAMAQVATELDYS